MNKYFKTPPQERPLLDLGVTAVPGVLTDRHLQEVDVGPAKLAELVVGFALDEASRRRVEPRRVV
ncbi:MAG TPA: hypothetical protein VIS56_02840, partial [Candidatus Saccharimonadales bacterium]